MTKFVHKGDAKKEYVRNMFNDVSKKYDLLNKLLSFGIDSYWRNRLIKSMNVNDDSIILDIATGTGDVVFEILKNNSIKIIGLDYAENMIEVAKEKAHLKNLSHLTEFIHGDAENLPFNDSQFNSLSISFGFRNIGNYERALSEFNRVLKNKGKLSILEFSEPKLKLFNIIYKLYFRYVLPRIGFLVSKSDGYKYLPESVEHFPSRKEVSYMISSAGFSDINIKNLTFGVCSIFTAIKHDKK
tara:strand:- start:975 stop:1700 length:726 start_codon:yes stop_codon:yes gene_type:complete